MKDPGVAATVGLERLLYVAAVCTLRSDGRPARQQPLGLERETGGSNLINSQSRQNIGARKLAAGASLAAAAFMALTFLPVLEGAVVVLACLASLSILLALFFGFRSAPFDSTGPRGKAGIGAAIVAAFLIAALLTYGLSKPGREGAGGGGPSLNFDQSTSVRVDNVSEEVIEVTPEMSESSLDGVIEKSTEVTDELVELTGKQKDYFVSEARAAGYITQSGLDEDWASATVQTYQGSTMVSVPLTGTDIPIITKSVFIFAQNGIDVFEYAARTLDPTHIELNIWQNDTSIKSATLDFTKMAASSDSIVQAGFSWRNVALCMANAGIPGAIVTTIGVACAVTCAATAGFGCAVCAAALSGAWGGTVALCIDKERKRA